MILALSCLLLSLVASLVRVSEGATEVLTLHSDDLALVTAVLSTKSTSKALECEFCVLTSFAFILTAGLSVVGT